jgi:hypothetical protein
MASHYKQIDGKKYSAELLNLADEMQAGKGDGRISIDDAEKLFSKLGNDAKYTDLEKDTLSYIRNSGEYKFTDAADGYLRGAIRSWAAERGHKNN